jgi:hypothetical protein
MYTTRRTSRQEDTSIQKDRLTGGHKFTEGQVDRRPQVYRRIGSQKDTSV